MGAGEIEVVSSARLASLAVLAVLLSSTGAAALVPDVVAAGNLNGYYKPAGDCVFEPNVVFHVDLAGGDGRLEMAGWGALACIVGTQSTHWVNYCWEESDGRIVCGDDDLSTDDPATAILEADGSFVFENELWRFQGNLARLSTTP